MFLRSFDVWSDGEKALTLAITLEEACFNKRNKDDLSVQLLGLSVLLDRRVKSGKSNS